MYCIPQTLGAGRLRLDACPDRVVGALVWNSGRCRSCGSLAVHVDLPGEPGSVAELCVTFGALRRLGPARGGPSRPVSLRRPLFTMAGDVSFITIRSVLWPVNGGWGGYSADDGHPPLPSVTPAVHRPSSAVYRPPPTAHLLSPPPAAHRPPSTNHRPPTAHRPPSTVHCPSPPTAHRPALTTLLSLALVGRGRLGSRIGCAASLVGRTELGRSLPLSRDRPRPRGALELQNFPLPPLLPATHRLPPTAHCHPAVSPNHVIVRYLVTKTSD